MQKFGKLDLVGKSFGILKIEGLPIDFAFPRKDNKVGNKHTSFESIVDPDLALDESARRRDFTMNAIMKNTRTKEILDPFNGVQDIHDRVIRLVDKRTFSEDPLRILRAAQFSARFNFDVDPEIITEGKKLDYTQLSVERVSSELLKGLMSDKPSRMLQVLKETNVLKQLSPNLDELANVNQNLEWHPEGNVWTHTLQVVDMGAKLRDKTSNPMGFMLTCLVHDIGKLKTTKVINGKVTSHKHDVVGAEMVEETLHNLINDKSLIAYAKTMTENHMVGHMILTMRYTTLRRKMYQNNLNDLLLFNICDNSKGNKSLDEAIIAADYEKKLRRVSDLEQGGHLKVVPYVQGRDLINLGLTPSKEFKKYLDEALTFQIAGLSRDKILNIIKRHYVDTED